MGSPQPGILYIVATPIGHLDDISHRAVETLKSCDWIACEDTRHSKKLCHHHGIDTPLKAYHQHNEQQASSHLIEQLLLGKHVALVSDAGTPLISDPGYVMVAKAHQAGITVSPIPGPSALITLLSVAGLDTQNFQFYGFPPSKSGQRLKALGQWLPSPSTTVIYESSHRIMGCLADLANVMGGDHKIAMGREMTKTFETIYHDTIDAIIERLQSQVVEQKGEFVIAIAGKAQQQAATLSQSAQSLATLLQPLLPPKQAAKVVATHHDCDKKAVYQFISTMTKDG